MNNQSSELEFKSLDYSTNRNNKDWVIISLKIVKPLLNTAIDFGSSYFIFRKIAYLNEKGQTVQTGSLFIPLCSISNLFFFFRILISGKTFGHYVSLKYPGKYNINCLISEQIENLSNQLICSSKINFSRREIIIPSIKFSCYVEEELEIT